MATLSRYVRRVAAALCAMTLAGIAPPSTLIVDSTSVRVASTEPKADSGDKHHRRAKVQVVIRKDGRILDVSQRYPGAVHDKKVWSMEAARLLSRIRGGVLGDKANAGGVGEGTRRLRPIKRGEGTWRLGQALAKTHNAGLSKIRVRIEHGFARLKTWKVLSGLFPYHWTKLGDVVRALAAAYNTQVAVAAGEL